MLTIYAPFNNPKSKAWEVFDGVVKSWPDQISKLDNAIETEPVTNSMFWGFVNNNLEMVKKLEARNHKYWFTDTPYFGRFDNNNLKADNHYWRTCKNSIHVPVYDMEIIEDIQLIIFHSIKQSLCNNIERLGQSAVSSPKYEKRIQSNEIA